MTSLKQKWRTIPDLMQMEVAGKGWSEEQPNGQPGRNFHIRYVYDMPRQTLYLDIIESMPDETSRTAFQYGKFMKPETFYLAVAAIEEALASTDIISERKISQFVRLLDLYENNYSSDVYKYTQQARTSLTERFAKLFETFEKAMDMPGTVTSAEEETDSVVRVDFQSGKRAYMPPADLLEQMRGAIQRVKDRDSPVTKFFGSQEPL